MSEHMEKEKGMKCNKGPWDLFSLVLCLTAVSQETSYRLSMTRIPVGIHPQKSIAGIGEKAATWPAMPCRQLPLFLKC